MAISQSWIFFIWLMGAVNFAAAESVVTHPDNEAHHMVIKEVQEGETATLPCPSNDDDHRFLFWQLEDDKVIGPANPDTRGKYKYEVLTGELTIKKTSEHDSGHYRCISKGLKKPTYLIEQVDLVVKKDWEFLWEHDTTVNLLRGVLAMIVIGVLCSIIYVIFRMKRSGYIKGEDLSDDEMGPEEIRDGPYLSTTRRASHEDISLVDTDLPRALNSMYTDRL